MDEYMVVGADNPLKLTEAVNAALSDGCTLVGGVAVSPVIPAIQHPGGMSWTPMGLPRYLQAMARSKTARTVSPK